MDKITCVLIDLKGSFVSIGDSTTNWSEEYKSAVEESTALFRAEETSDIELGEYYDRFDITPSTYSAHNVHVKYHIKFVVWFLVPECYRDLNHFKLKYPKIYSKAMSDNYSDYIINELSMSRHLIEMM